MPALRLVNVTNDYILRNVNLEVKDKELFVLLGPSGSGKTTLLKAIAGLIKYRGNIFFDDEAIDGLPPERRCVGYLPQNLVLFSHMTVASNVGYSLRIRERPKNEVENRVDELLEMMGISHLKDRYPKDLSGGEQQRVALARVLASEPKIFLLDEPFNSLDPKTAGQLRLELKRIQKNIGITTVLVTHNLAEAEEMSDKVGIFYNGELLQASSLNELIFSPNEKFSSIIGTMNVLRCDRYDVLEGFAKTECEGLRLLVPFDGHPIRKVAISSKDILISAERIYGPSINLYQGTVLESLEQGSNVILRIKVEDGPVLTSEVSKEIYSSQGLSVGKKVHVKIKLKTIRTR